MPGEKSELQQSKHNHNSYHVDTALPLLSGMIPPTVRSMDKYVYTFA